MKEILSLLLSTPASNTNRFRFYSRQMKMKSDTACSSSSICRVKKTHSHTENAYTVRSQNEYTA